MQIQMPNTNMQIQICKYRYPNKITQIPNQERIITKREYMHEVLTFLCLMATSNGIGPQICLNTHLSSNLSLISKCFAGLKKGEGVIKKYFLKMPTNIKCTKYFTKCACNLGSFYFSRRLSYA